MAEPKKYVGMRYVPKFAEPLEWNTNNKYEPLEMVLHEGNYYISRQFVPMDIDINNKEYWLPFALTLDGAAGLVSRVDSNTDAIIQNATALHEVENKATQNALDIVGNTSSIASNTEDIATNLEMINKLVDHETWNQKIIDYSPNNFGYGYGHMKIYTSVDKGKIFINSDIFDQNFPINEEVIVAPAGTTNGNILSCSWFFTGEYNSTSLRFNSDGSISINVSTKSIKGLRASGLIDLGLITNTMTLPMTEDDYNQLESEVK